MRIKGQFLIGAVAALAVGATTLPANASLTLSVSGPPIPSGSWDQAFDLASSVGDIHSLAVVYSGDFFGRMSTSAPGAIHTFVGASGWTQALGASPFGAQASGSGTSNLGFSVHFEGSQGDGRQRTLHLWALGSSGQPLNTNGLSIDISYNGSVWGSPVADGSLTWTAAQSILSGSTATTPAPSAALLAGIGLLLSARMNRRRKSA